MIQQKVRKEKSVLMLIFQNSQSKITGVSEMWSLKSLVMLTCESRTSLHAVQNK